MEKNMETTIVYWGYIGIMEEKMETTTLLQSERVLLPSCASEGFGGASRAPRSIPAAIPRLVLIMDTRALGFRV